VAPAPAGSVGREGRVGTDGSAASRAGRSVGPSRPEICVAALRASVGRSGRTESETLPTATRESVGNYGKLTFNFASPEAQNEKHRDQESLIHYLSATLRASPGPVATTTARRQHAGGIASRRHMPSHAWTLI